MQIGSEAVATVKMQGKGGGDDIALVATDQVKEFEARGYKVVKAEAPKP